MGINEYPEKKSKKKILFFTFVTVFIIMVLTQINVMVMFFSTDREMVSDRVIKIESKIETSKARYMWWEISNDTLNLNVNSAINRNAFSIYGLMLDETVKDIPAGMESTAIKLTDDLSGSFIAVMTPFQADMNNDGVKEDIQISAKVDTIFTQGFIPLYTFFNSDKVGLEVYYLGNHDIKMLMNSQPLSGKEITVLSTRGLNQKVVLNKDGVFSIGDIRDLRAGISVMFAEDGIVNIANYLVEGNTLFTGNHLKALYPLFFAIGISIDLILVIVVITGFPFKKRVIISEIRNF